MVDGDRPIILFLTLRLTMEIAGIRGVEKKKVRQRDNEAWSRLAVILQ